MKEVSCALPPFWIMIHGILSEGWARLRGSYFGTGRGFPDFPKVLFSCRGRTSYFPNRPRRLVFGASSRPRSLFVLGLSRLIRTRLSFIALMGWLRITGNPDGGFRRLCRRRASRNTSRGKVEISLSRVTSSVLHHLGGLRKKKSTTQMSSLPFLEESR